MGDLNLDTLRWPQLGSQKKGWPYVWWVDQLYEHLINGSGMCFSEVPGSTWVSKDGTRESCLDIHLTNRPDKVKSVKILNEFSSDHQTLVMERTDQDIAGNVGCTKRKWSQVDYIWCVESYAYFLAHKVNNELLRIHDADEVAE